MGSSLLPNRRVLRGESRNAWITLRDTDMEEKYSSARDIPADVRAYERSRWRLVSDDPDEQQVSAEDIAWQHLDADDLESCYYNGRVGDDSIHGQNIDASLSSIHAIEPVVQPCDSRPTLDWHALGGQAAVATLLKYEAERREGFIERLTSKLRTIEHNIALTKDRLSQLAVADYTRQLKAKHVRLLRVERAEALYGPDPTQHKALSDADVTKIEDMANARTVDGVRLHILDQTARLCQLTRQRPVVIKGLRAAEKLTFVMSDQEYRAYAKLMTAKTEAERSYCDDADSDIRARFPMLICACGCDRVRIRRHPDHHWYSSCPECDDMAPLHVRDVEPATLPDTQYKELARIRNAVWSELRQITAQENT